MFARKKNHRIKRKSATGRRDIRTLDPESVGTVETGCESPKMNAPPIRNIATRRRTGPRPPSLPKPRQNLFECLQVRWSELDGDAGGFHIPLGLPPTRSVAPSWIARATSYSERQASRECELREARAYRVLAKVSRLRELSSRAVTECVHVFTSEAAREVRFGGTPKPARETRALPGFPLREVL